MNVLFLPLYYPNNPYQFLLINKLDLIGVKVVCVKNEKHLFLFSNFSFYRQINIIHFHWTHPYMLDKSYLITIVKSVKFIAELLILKLIGVKIVYTIHNLINHQKLHPKTEKFFLKILIKYIFDKIIGHGPSVQTEVSNTFNLDYSYKKKSIIIPHGHYIDYYPNTLSKEKAREKFKFPNNSKVFLYFGLIRQYKGLPELVYAFNKLKTENIYLIIAGKPDDDEFLSWLKKQFCKNIIVHPWFIPNEEIQYYMNAADVVVLPYRDILTSGSLLLSMSFGKAIVIPNMGCLADHLNTNGGILYDHTDDESLFNSMKNILEMDIEKMGAYNLDLVSRNNSWDTIADKTKEVYLSIMN